MTGWTLKAAKVVAMVGLLIAGVGVSAALADPGNGNGNGNGSDASTTVPGSRATTFARQPGCFLPSRPRREREGLRGPRERQGRRGPLRHDHDDRNHAYNRDHDHERDHNHVPDDHDRPGTDHESGFIRKRSWEPRITGELGRRVSASGVRSPGRAPEQQQRQAPAQQVEGALVARPAATRRAQSCPSRVSGLGSRPARLGGARSRARASQSRIKSRFLARHIAVAHSGHRDVSRSRVMKLALRRPAHSLLLAGCGGTKTVTKTVT